MKISQDGIEMIKRFEGIRLHSYKDSVGVWTIGVGHTGKDVHADMVIDEKEVDRLLRQDLEWVEKCINENVTVQLTQERFDVLCSFVFNLGCGAFKHSTLLKKINHGDIAGATKEFYKWDHAGGRVLAGLTRRRETEAERFGRA